MFWRATPSKPARVSRILEALEKRLPGYPSSNKPAFCGLDTMRTDGEYRRFLHIWSVGDDTDSRTDEKHRHRKPYKSWCGTCLTAGNPQNILVAQKNRKRRLLRQSNEF